MSAFREQLRAAGAGGSTRGRRWFFVPYDQLHSALGARAGLPPQEIGVVLVEAPAKAARRPYHRQKLALVLANLRQFALEQARRGVAVRHVVSEGPGYAAPLERLSGELGPLEVCEPAEWELRQELAPLLEQGRLRVAPHDGWLSEAADFDALGEAPWRMDAFYRGLRRRTGVLMTPQGKPEGGKYSFDADNRRPWRGEPPAASPPRFEPDAVTREVGDLVERHFARHPGRLDLGALPATAEDAERLWSWAQRDCLPQFGPFEDAMSLASRTLFHTRISALLNLHRLLPARVLQDALSLSLPLASREGFVRQLLGWREFVRHVHRRTEGFRQLPDGAPPTRARPGDGDWARAFGRPWDPGEGSLPDAGGAAPSALGGDRPLPPAFWGAAPSGLRCLDAVVESVWEEGYSHHITRLMVLSNLATLLDVSPRALTDWFWVAYTDAFDWVVEPNVLGMGTFAVGELMTTKPYVCGANYIAKMSDYCGGCAFDPRKSCPITPLYWAFLDRHAGALGANPRLSIPLASLKRRAPERRAADADTFAWVSRTLGAGEALAPPRAPRAGGPA